MKRLLLAIVGTLAVAAASALAADMPPSRSLPLPRAPAYVPFFTWNGFYIGINAGYGFGRSAWTDTVTQDSTGNFNVNGPMVGGTVGYNLQFGTFVLGLEGDLDWTNIKGYAFDRFLPYITGGGAYGDVKGSLLGVGDFKQTKAGWTGGAGVEYAFIDNWSAKIEYLYVDLGKATCDAACSGANPITATFKSNVVRAGLNYKF
jgi:outer membrane immunogenic protein